jgi:hypothetical protein
LCLQRAEELESKVASMESNKQALAGAYSRKLKTVRSPTHTPT